jgi:hypothetical protein
LALLLTVNVVLLASNIGFTSGSFLNEQEATGNAFQAWLSTKWTQTSQADFESGVTSQVDTATSSGDVILAEGTPVTVASDGFEGGWSGGSGWLGGWWHEGSSSITSSGTPHTGSNHLLLGEFDGYVDRAVNLTGRSNARLQFWAKADSFEEGDTVECLIYDGVAWDTVETWVDGDDDNIYKPYDIDLSGYNMSNQFYVCFDSDMSSDFDYLYIDDIVITEQPDYCTSGTVASQVLDTTIAGSIWDVLFWEETLQGNTDITFEVRASDAVFLKDAGAPGWNAVGGASPVDSGLSTGRYKQWRATLSTTDTSNTPTLHEVRVYYH